MNDHPQAEHPKRVGDRTTLAIMLALTDAGLDVSVPFGENCRYDLVIDNDGKLTRVQCKTGRLRNGAVRFSTASTYSHLPSPRESRRHYMGQIDEFAVFCPDTGDVYLIPIADVRARTNAYLRVEAPGNGQRRGVRFARTYLVASIRIGDSRATRRNIVDTRGDGPTPGTTSQRSPAPAGCGSGPRDGLDATVDVRLRRRPVRDRNPEQALTTPGRRPEPAGPILLHPTLHPIGHLRVAYPNEDLIEHDVVDDVDAGESVETGGEPPGQSAAPIDEIDDP